MVRKKPSSARTCDIQLKEKEHYSDTTFVRTIIFSLNENLVYHIGTMNRDKPLLEVTKILQRVGPTDLRSVVANRHLILGWSNVTLVLPVSMPVKDLSLNTVVGIIGAFSPIHIAISGTLSPIHIAPPLSDIANVNKDLVPHRNFDGPFRQVHSQIKICTVNSHHVFQDSHFGR